MGKLFQGMMSLMWASTWLACIWIETFRTQLFVTGLFMMALGVLDVASEDHGLQGKCD